MVRRLRSHTSAHVAVGAASVHRIHWSSRRSPLQAATIERRLVGPEKGVLGDIFMHAECGVRSILTRPEVWRRGCATVTSPMFTSTSRRYCKHRFGVRRRPNRYERVQAQVCEQNRWRWCSIEALRSDIPTDRCGLYDQRRPFNMLRFADFTRVWLSQSERCINIIRDFYPEGSHWSYCYILSDLILFTIVFQNFIKSTIYHLYLIGIYFNYILRLRCPAQ